MSVLAMLIVFAKSGYCAVMSTITVINKSKIAVECFLSRNGAVVQSDFVVKRKKTAKFNIPSGKIEWYCVGEGSGMSMWETFNLIPNKNITFTCHDWYNRYGDDASCDMISGK
jgi:hypothetical protein